MRKDHTEIVESNLLHLLRLKPGNIKEYSYREKNGFIRIEAGKNLILESSEFKARNELTKVLPVRRKKEIFLR